MTKETGDLGLGFDKQSAFAGNTGATYQRDKENVSYMYTLPPQEILSNVRLSFYEPPPTVGYWVFPGSKKGFETKFSMTGKPNRFHRLMMKWVLGWVWEDVK